MAVVELLDSCMVTPSEATPKHRLWLSNLDLMVPRSHTPLIFFYRSRPGKACFSPDVLKAALSKALVPYYPLAGRLAPDCGGRPEIHCTGGGVLFVTASADATLDGMGHPAPSDELRRMFVPSAEGSEHAGILTMFQVTFFKCGGVCLGTSGHHMVTDGRAFASFLNTWAAIARGDGEAAMPQPCLDRTLLSARSPPDVRFDHVEYKDRGGGVSKTKVSFHTAILPISGNQVNVLKDAVAAGVRGKKISTFNAVVAHVWRCACMALELRGTDDNTRVYMTTDGRSRICPPLPSNYLGNAVFRTSAVGKVSDVVSSPLSITADRVSDAIARVSNEYIRSLVDYMELEGANTGSMAGQRAGAWVIPETDLLVISWLGLSFSNVDFGWGRPTFFGRAMTLSNGLVYLVPVPDSDGQLNVVVAMEPKRLSRFKQLFYEELMHVASDIHVANRSKL